MVQGMQKFPEDIVLLKAEASRNQWPMSKVVSVNADDMGFV